MTTLEWLSFGVMAGFTLVAAIMDYRSRRIPNWFTVPMFVAGIVFQTATNGVSGLGTAMAGFGTGFGILFVLWLIGGGGGGDVKMMGALGTWLGASWTLTVFVLSAGFAALFTVAMLTYSVARHGYGYVSKRYFRSPFQDLKHKKGKLAEEEISRRKAKRGLLPYALPLAAGTWVFLVWHVLKTT
jgi:prepilin peptidase CpaA